METSVIRSRRTAVELFRMLPEGVQCEVIENILYMSPEPTSKHFDIQKKIIRILDRFIIKSKNGELYWAPFDVFINENNAVQPDIFFISKSNRGYKDPDGGFEGVPDLIVEILSPSNREHDLGKKKDVYEKAGVKELFIIDPYNELVKGFINSKNGFVELPEIRSKIKSKFFAKEFKF